ncbi:5-oxoprolinase subunit PxpB [Aliivibrio kagoshimensis]|uniref:5-oxoprolinase subunit PxpB n=1 Tax=Aliivibrio kagoshimensis TaxID=2910230 RepID=UPI003D1103F3
MLALQISQVTESALIIYCADQIDPNNSVHIANFCHQISLKFSDKLLEVTPSYTSIFIEFDLLKIRFSTLKKELTDLNAQLDSLMTSSSNCITLPVYYDQEVAPDLQSIAEQKGVSVAEVIAIHNQRSYSVCAIGFAPGFAFLASVDERIRVPRLAKPRLNIPAGSVGIADQQTAVYPDASPGGWQIIGNCPVSLFNPNTQPMMPYAIGDTVKFESISKSEFLSLGGKICQNWK